MNKNVSYASLVRRHRTEFVSRLPAFLARNRWPKERIDAEREAQLRRLLAHAKRHSPWHARRLAHIDAETATEADLTRIPPMTKADLIANFDQISTDPRISLEVAERHFALLEEGATPNTYLFDEFHVVGTSGTTGLRGLFVYDWESWLVAALSLARGRAVSAAEIPAKPGAKNVVLAADKGWHLSVAIPQIFARDVAISVFLPFKEILRRLNALQPHMLSGYPSILYQLCLAAEAGELRIAPAAITGAAEPLLPKIREALEHTFGARVFDAWVCSEAAMLGHSCPKTPGLHLSDDLAVVEPIDAQGARVDAGMASAGILVTTLFNTLLPLIRYEMSDSVTPLESTGPCACGSHFRKIASVGGRVDHAFTYTGTYAGRIYVHPFTFDFQLSLEPSILEYQAYQTEKGARILVRASRDFDRRGLARKIEAALTTLGLADPEVVIELVTELSRGATGKLTRFVPLKA